MKGIALAAALAAIIAADGARKAGAMNLTLTAVDGIKGGTVAFDITSKEDVQIDAVQNLRRAPPRDDARRPQ